MNSTQSYDYSQGLSPKSTEPIAIVGLAGRFPKAKNVREFWKRLYNEEDCITRTPGELQPLADDSGFHKGPTYIAAAPVLEDVDRFDAAFFGITPREAELMDPQQRIFLECCWEALEDAGYDPKSSSQATAVFAGARTNTYIFNILTHRNLARAAGAFHIGLGNDLAFLSTRVSHFLNLTGPSVSVHTACSTSLVAVHLACEALRQHHCSAALAGGVAVNVPHEVGYEYEEGSVQSPDGYCRTFDASARGTVFGSGAGVVLLKRLDDAIASQDSIYAIIRGSAINNDGSDKASFTAPSVQGQVNVIRDALRAADVHPDTIGYVECHGTGTLLGDAIEVRALIKSFGKGPEASCALGSVKTNVGHLDAAAGMTGLIKTVLSLKHRTIPASLHYVKPNPQIKFEGTRFYVNQSTSPWLSRRFPRRAGVSAFGVGGTNAHVILEEAPPVDRPAESGEWQVLPLSARSSSALLQAVRTLTEHLEDERCRLNLDDVALTLQEGRHAFEFRHAVVCRTIDEAITELRNISTSEESFRSCGDIPPNTTFLFPGQGAQYVGMGKELYDFEPVFRAQIRECSDILKPWLQEDLISILYEFSDSTRDQRNIDLTQTRLAQPAILAVEFALAKLWMSWGIEPQSMLGHSVGEYTAAVLSGVMSIEDALRLIAIRGQLMQQTAPGAMLAVSLSEAEATQWLSSGLSIAALNGPDLCTIAGEPEEVRALESELRARGIACQALRTSHAFHTPAVEPAAKRYIEEVKKIRLNSPTIPFISCVTGTWIQPEQAQRPRYWSEQMLLPVQFDAGLTELMRNDEDRVLLDVGPGQTLRRLALRRGHSSVHCRVVGAMPPSNSGSEFRSVLRALGEMWESGLPVNWGKTRRGLAQRISLPTYPFERSPFWIHSLADSDRTSPRLATATVPRTSHKEPDVSRWFWIPSLRLTGPVSGKASGSGGWLVYCDRTGLGDQVCFNLESVGETVIRIEPGSEFRRINNLVYEMDPATRQHHEELWVSIAESGIKIANVVSLSSFDHAIQRGTDDFPHRQSLVTELIRNDLFGIQAMLGHIRDQPCKYWMVSTSLMDIERVDVIDPAVNGIIGLLRTSTEEYAAFDCRVIDVVAEKEQSLRIQTAKLIVDETRSEATDEIVAYRGTKRWIRDFKRLAVSMDRLSSMPPQPQNGAYLVLGGLGTVGLQVAEHLAVTQRAPLVLTSRTPLPTRTQWSDIVNADSDSILAHRIQSILRVEETGVEVETLEVDITDYEQMSAAISSVEAKYGQVLGIIHTAGVTSDPSAFRVFGKLDPKDFSDQSRAKLHGLYVLADVIRNRNVPFVLMMSSNSSIVGGVGFAAYAAGNCSMNALAQKLTKLGQNTRWLSVSWDHWPEGKSGGPPIDLSELYGDLTEAEITRALETKYRYAMSKDEVAIALSYVLGFEGSGHLIVSTGDLEERLSLLSSRDRGGDPNHFDDSEVPSHKRTQRPQLKTIFVKPRNELETELAAVWADFLGVDEVGIHDDFFELGGHSLLATKLVSGVREKFDSDLPLAKLFEGPTVAQMASHITPSLKPLH